MIDDTFGDVLENDTFAMQRLIYLLLTYIFLLLTILMYFFLHLNTRLIIVRVKNVSRMSRMLRKCSHAIVNELLLGALLLEAIDRHLHYLLLLNSVIFDGSLNSIDKTFLRYLTV